MTSNPSSSDQGRQSEQIEGRPDGRFLAGHNRRADLSALQHRTGEDQMLSRQHDQRRHDERRHEPDRDWRNQAACREVDPELFFPVGTSGAAHDAQVAEAKAVCADCPVLQVCRAWAIEALPVGVAGGLTEDERRTLRRSRPPAPAPVIEPPIGGNRHEYATAGRAAVAAGEPVTSVAGRFGVHVRTAEHWRAAVTTTTPATPASAASASGGAR